MFNVDSNLMDQSVFTTVKIFFNIKQKNVENCKQTCCINNNKTKNPDLFTFYAPYG